MLSSFHLNRRRMIGGIGLTVAAPAVLRAQESAPTEYVEIATAEGRLRGARVDGVSTFKGVRYAAPLTPQQRFRAPGKLPSWTGVRDALAYGAASIQPPSGNLGGASIAEDCLFLNIWTPATKADGKKRAVMYYLHGGGFTVGSGSARGQDGANLARNNDVVVIETNHRLGLLGYLWLGDLLGEEYATSGNQSLFDITEGLEWTRRNVEAFGGDPNNVMVWGESGGGAKTSSIYAFTPAAKLFHKASIESGPGIRMATREQAAATAKYVLDQLGITAGDAKKLLEVPADKLLAIQAAGAVSSGERAPGPPLTGMGTVGLNGYSSVVDGKYLPHHPFDPAAPAISADKPLIVGGNQDEATFFLRTSPDKSIFTLDEAGLLRSATQQYGPTNGPALVAAYHQDMPAATPAQIAVTIQSDSFSRVGSTRIAEEKVRQGRAPVYLYRLTEGVKAPIPGTTYPTGASHALDIGLKFDNSGPRASEPDGGAALQATAKNMSRLWAGFAKTGTPTAEGQPAWPAYNLATRPMMLIKAQCEVVSDAYPATRKIWSSLA
jgi:para-nitrobenzyl esterase